MTRIATFAGVLLLAATTAGLAGTGVANASPQAHTAGILPCGINPEPAPPETLIMPQREQVPAGQALAPDQWFRTPGSACASA